MLTSTRKQTAAANANDQRGGDDKRKQRPDVTARRILATKNPELVERAKRGGFDERRAIEGNARRAVAPALNTPEQAKDIISIESDRGKRAASEAFYAAGVGINGATLETVGIDGRHLHEILQRLSSPDGVMTPLELLLADTRPAAFIVCFASIPLTALPMLATLAVTIVIGSWVRRVVAAQVTRNQPDRTVVIL